MKASKSRRSILRKLKISLISLVGWIAVQAICRTLRFSVVNGDHRDRLREEGRPAILCFWHNQIFFATYHFRFQNIVVITSRHADGEFIARIIEKFGYGTARGSSTRGAVRALLELKKHLSNGRDVAFTIDGPRGPIYQVKPGPIWLSGKSGSPILPFHIEPEKYWSLRSWDRFRIPRPFSRMVVCFGNPISIDGSRSETEWLAEFQAEMERVQREAERRIRPRPSENP
jgi:lysophospholipid acyltransferase (LPLAT)-like uncharacterized protein